MARMITERELSDECDALLDAVEHGETLTITRHGRADIDDFFGDDDRIRDEDYK
jgi:hypothetical protein